MTRTNLLKAAMAENEYTAERLADEVGMSRQSFSLKVNNKRRFNSDEISKISHVLKLTPQRIIEIFFADDVGDQPTEL